MDTRTLTRGTMRRVVIPTLALGWALTIGLVPAEARWQVHNSADVTQIVAPSGSTEQRTTCTDHLRGQSGWSTSVPVGDDPNSYAPPAGSGAYGGVSYDVWKAPAGYTDGSFSQPDPATDAVDFYPTDGSGPVAAIFVRTFSTPPRQGIDPEYLYPDDVQTDPNSSNLYLFTFVGWDVLLPGVTPGELLGLKPSRGASSFLNVAAIHCDATKLHIHSMSYNPPGADTSVLNQETVVITNGSTQAKELGGWTLRDKDGNVYRFPTTSLAPGSSVTVHSGKGTNRTGHRYWGRTVPVWNDGGDNASLRNRAGSAVDACKYGGGGPGSVIC